MKEGSMTQFSQPSLNVNVSLQNCNSSPASFFNKEKYINP